MQYVAKLNDIENELEAIRTAVNNNSQVRHPPVRMETAATLGLRGSVIAFDTPIDGNIDYIKFQVSNATQSGEAVSLAAADLIVTYIDSSQSVNIGNVPNASSTQGWTATWLAGTGPLVNNHAFEEINDAELAQVFNLHVQ